MPPNARAGCRRRCMAAKGCERLLPLPCGPRQYRSVECLWTTLATIVVAHSTPTQSTTKVVGPGHPDLQAVDSSSTRSASLSCCSLPRHSSKVGAVCVEAPVRICAGGGQRWSSLPQHLVPTFFEETARRAIGAALGCREIRVVQRAPQ